MGRKRKAKPVTGVILREGRSERWRPRRDTPREVVGTDPRRRDLRFPVAAREGGALRRRVPRFEDRGRRLPGGGAGGGGEGGVRPAEVVLHRQPLLVDRKILLLRVAHRRQGEEERHGRTLPVPRGVVQQPVPVDERRDTPHGARGGDDTRGFRLGRDARG